MQRLVIAFSCVSIATCEDLCGSWELPNEPSHFDPTHSSQWRLVATEGQRQNGEIIKGVPGTDTTVIRGHWAIGEIEWYADPNCSAAKHPTLKKDKTQVSPLHTTFSCTDECPSETDFHSSLATDPPWYSEMRAIDGCYSSEFWSECYQCAPTDAWYGIKFHHDDKNATQIRCLKIFQKDADAYTATRVELQRWYPASEENEMGGWYTLGDWTGLNGGRWFILKSNKTVAIARTQRNAMPGLLGILGALLWIAC